VAAPGHSFPVTVAATYFLTQNISGISIPLPPNGLSRKLKSESGKIGSGSSFFPSSKIQQRRASEEKPINVNSDFVCEHKSAVAAAAFFVFCRFLSNSQTLVM